MLSLQQRQGLRVLQQALWQRDWRPQVLTLDGTTSRAMGSLQIASLVQELQRECVGGALAVLQGPPMSIWPL